MKVIDILERYDNGTYLAVIDLPNRPETLARNPIVCVQHENTSLFLNINAKKGGAPMSGPVVTLKKGQLCILLQCDPKQSDRYVVVRPMDENPMNDQDTTGLIDRFSIIPLREFIGATEQVGVVQSGVER